MSTEFTVNSMHMWQGETLQSIHQYIINPVQYPPPPIDLINRLSIYRVAARTLTVTFFFVPRVTAPGSAMVTVAVSPCRTTSSSIWRALLTTASVRTPMSSSFCTTLVRPNRSGTRRPLSEHTKTLSDPSRAKRCKDTHTHTTTQYFCSADWLKLSVVDSELTSFAVRSSWWNWTKMADQRIQRRWIVSVPSSR